MLLPPAPAEFVADAITSISALNNLGTAFSSDRIMAVLAPAPPARSSGPTANESREVAGPVISDQNMSFEDSEMTSSITVTTAGGSCPDLTGLALARHVLQLLMHCCLLGSRGDLAEQALCWLGDC